MIRKKKEFCRARNQLNYTFYIHIIQPTKLYIIYLNPITCYGGPTESSLPQETGEYPCLSINYSHKQEHQYKKYIAAGKQEVIIQNRQEAPNIEKTNSDVGYPLFHAAHSPSLRLACLLARSGPLSTCKQAPEHSMQHILFLRGSERGR